MQDVPQREPAPFLLPTPPRAHEGDHHLQQEASRMTETPARFQEWPGRSTAADATATSRLRRTRSTTASPNFASTCEEWNCSMSNRENSIEPEARSDDKS